MQKEAGGISGRAKQNKSCLAVLCLSHILTYPPLFLFVLHPRGL